ncbi:bacteriophage spanin2 family protein [Rhodovulum sulfidophilum]|uniref:bacteriophage spanin2 family protein n=1 Tax=Rhodovulum sulfidophilum TaxID=35806 RepID=UPI0019226009|nr:bacteriophage spanin2 family protein [Rhodovulum sulfidophilum]
MGTDRLRLEGCRGLPVPLGPNVAANVQAGAENVQGQKVENAPSIVRPRAREIRQEQSENRLRADRVDTVIVNVIPPWIVLVALIGCIAPRPARSGGGSAKRSRAAGPESSAVSMSCGFDGSPRTTGLCSPPPRSGSWWR